MTGKEEKGKKLPYTVCREIGARGGNAGGGGPIMG